MEDASAMLVDWAKFARMRTELGADFVRILGYFREDGEKSVVRIEEAMHRKEAAALIIPAHTLKTEARQFGADPLGDLAEEIEYVARRSLESRLFPDHVLPQVARLRPLYAQTMALLEQETNPLAVRRSAQGRAPSNQEFGRL
jgi:histidine phosphotransfer protein HptB